MGGELSITELLKCHPGPIVDKLGCRVTETLRGRGVYRPASCRIPEENSREHAPGK